MPKQERKVEAKVEDIKSGLEKELWAVFAGKIYCQILREKVCRWGKSWLNSEIMSRMVRCYL